MTRGSYVCIKSSTDHAENNLVTHNSYDVYMTLYMVILLVNNCNPMYTKIPPYMHKHNNACHTMHSISHVKTYKEKVILYVIVVSMQREQAL